MSLLARAVATMLKLFTLWTFLLYITLRLTEHCSDDNAAMLPPTADHRDYVPQDNDTFAVSLAQYATAHRLVLT